MGNFDDNNIANDSLITDLESLQFYQTQAHPCSYLFDESAKTVFLNPQQKIDNAVYSQLSEFGFRRSGNHIYKPMCQKCHACIPLRVPVSVFEPTRQQKRTISRNKDLAIRAVKTIDTDEHYALYHRYIEERHADGDMYPPTQEQFTSFLAGDWSSVSYYEFRLDGRLLAVSVADILDNGVSAIYTYFDPHESKRSLGRFAILTLINIAKKKNLPAVYLGYWIKSSDKMRYKSEYRPLEILIDDRWLRVM